MPNKRTREKQLQKLAAQRRAARKRHARQRGTAIALVVVAVLLAGFFIWQQVFNNNSSAAKTAQSRGTCTTKAPPTAGEKKPVYKNPPPKVIEPGKTYTAVLDTSCGTFDIQLDQKLAPNTVNSFVYLAQHHFFDGLTFHRIARHFVIQGGDPKGNGTGGPGYETRDVPPKDATYPIGTVAMAKGGSQPAGTAGSQFFVVTSSSANQSLAPASQGPQYAIIGHVTSGMDAVNAIAALPIQGNSSDGPPAQKVYINTMTIKVS